MAIAVFEQTPAETTHGRCHARPPGSITRHRCVAGPAAEVYVRACSSWSRSSNGTGPLTGPRRAFYNRWVRRGRANGQPPPGIAARPHPHLLRLRFLVLRMPLQSALRCCRVPAMPKRFARPRPTARKPRAPSRNCCPPPPRTLPESLPAVPSLAAGDAAAPGAERQRPRAAAGRSPTCY